MTKAAPVLSLRLSVDYRQKPGVLRDVAIDIRQGEILGLAGSSGKSTGAHLHYEVRVHSTPVNPYRFLQRSAAIKPVAQNDLPF